MNSEAMSAGPANYCSYIMPQPFDGALCGSELDCPQLQHLDRNECLRRIEQRKTGASLHGRTCLSVLRALASLDLQAAPSTRWLVQLTEPA